MKTLKPLSVLWRMIAVTVVCGMALLVLQSTIDNPVSAPTSVYTADFTDVSGLHANSDVRIRGVRVGKVVSVDLTRADNRTLGQVTLTLDQTFSIGPKSHLAIKYQALTGLRYIDVADAAQPGPGSTTHIATGQTSGSFDITDLFNGLQPVLSTLSPDEINTFTANAATVLEGDGDGLGPMLDSINRLARFARNRQQVVSQIMTNLSQVAGKIGGSSPEFIQILDWFNRPLDSSLKVLDEFRKSDAYGPMFSSSLIRLFNNLGIRRDLNIDALLSQAFESTGAAASALASMPAILTGLASSNPNIDQRCTRGRAVLPPGVEVLLSGQQVTLCNS